MNFNHLKAFWAVAKNLSYSEAARELYVSQSTVSIQVNKLEQALGIELFEQIGRKVYLTRAGEELYRYADRIFSLAEQAKLSIQEMQGLNTGRLVIGASTTPGIYLLPPIISSFQRKYPSLEVSLEISNTHKVQEQLLANELDLGIVGQELVNENLHIELLLHDELVVITSPCDELAGQSSVSIGDLSNHRLILREPGSNTREILEERARQQGVELKASMQLSSVEAIKKAVMANLGISVVSRLALELELNSGVLKALSFSDHQLSREINLVYHQDKKLMPATQEFVSYLKQRLWNNYR